MKIFPTISAIAVVTLLSMSVSAGPETFYTLESALKKPTDVRVLELHNKSMKELPTTVEGLTNIEVLDLSDNQLTEIPEAVYHMPNLKKLILTGNNIQRIPEYINELKNLEEFSISLTYAALSDPKAAPCKLPDGLMKLPKLRVVTASYYNLAAIPPSITLSHIQELYLDHNKITAIPNTLFTCRTLRVMDLSNNLITALPLSIGACPTMEVLRLDNNKFTEIPVSITNLKNLKELGLGNNNLSKPVIDVKKIIPLTHLAFLHLNNIGLDVLPAEFAQLSEMRELDLDGNQLASIEPICKLSKLKKLAVANNKLSDVPSSIADLVNIQKLDLSHNELKSIPPELAKLHGLQMINLSYNPELDDYSENLKMLKSVSLVNLKNTALNGFQQHHINDLLIAATVVYQ